MTKPSKSFPGQKMRLWWPTAPMWTPDLWRWHQGGSYFVVRFKESVKFNRLEEKSLPEGRHEHILVDEYIELSKPTTHAKYPKKLRRVVVYDAQKDQKTKPLN